MGNIISGRFSFSNRLLVYGEIPEILNLKTFRQFVCEICGASFKATQTPNRHGQNAKMNKLETQFKSVKQKEERYFQMLREYENKLYA